MKELSTEEKAKRYDEALERARELSKTITGAQYDYIFPELKEVESEDERIRKELIFYFTEEIPQCSIQEHSDKMREFISWLKRQEVERTKLKLKAGNSYFCYKSRWERADNETFKKGLIYKCNKDGVLDNFVINNPEQHFIEIKDERIAWLEKQGEQDNNEDEAILYRFSFYSYKDEPNILYLAGIYVNDKYRNKGIGTKILEVANEVSKSMNCRAIRLKTKKDSNAERLYRTHGYNSLAIERNKIWLEKQQKSIINVPSREVILAIWDLGNEWKELTNGSISTEYGTQLYYIQKHWQESEMYLRAKQDEQKPTDKVEPKFNVGKWIAYEVDAARIINIDDDRYEVEFIDGSKGFLHIDYVDRLFHLWAIQDAKPSDVLVDVYGNIGIFKQYDDFDWTSYCSLGINGGFQHFEVEHENEKTYPATKEQRDTLMKAMVDAGYTFDFDKKELKKVEQESTWNEKIKGLNELETYILSLVPDRSLDTIKVDAKNIRYIINKEQKSAWSEEDEKMVLSIEQIVQCTSLLNIVPEKVKNWFKSIKNRVEHQSKQ